MSQSPLDGNEAVALIIDTSSSADAELEGALMTARTINYMGLKRLQMFMLDSPEPVSPETIKQPMPPGARQQVCSLIAPVIERVVREEQKHSVIVLGGGEIFDLEDWIDDPHLESWLLVCTGEQSLQGSNRCLAEITHDQITDDVDTLLTYFSRVSRRANETFHSRGGPARYEWKVDAAGYPLIYVDPLDSFVQLFPVTKPQFEKFLSDAKPQELGDEWYSQILEMNPRASYRSQEILVRERLFMTGITVVEAMSFSRWLGRDYAMLSADEWSRCYEWFASKPAPAMPTDLEDRLSRDALGIWRIIDGQWLEHHVEPTLLDLSLMTDGILEWVIERPGRFCGLGAPSSKYQRKASDPVRPLGPEPRRLKNLGFRLRRR